MDAEGNDADADFPEEDREEVQLETKLCFYCWSRSECFTLGVLSHF